MKILQITALSGGTLAAFLLKKRQIPQPNGPPYQVLPKTPFKSHPNTHYLSKIPQTIGIIGSGLSGICAAKEFKLQGYTVEVLEKNSGVGGVWHANYSGLRLEGVSSHYSFPDYPISSKYSSCAELSEVRQFLQSYCDKFDVTQRIRFNSEVCKINQKPDYTWQVFLTDGSVKQYDFLIISPGLFNIPYIPEIAGKFNGKILHSSEVTEPESYFQGKNVIIVGSGRSSQEISQIALQYTKNVWAIRGRNRFCLNPTNSFLTFLYLELISSKLASLLLPSYETGKKSIFKPIVDQLLKLTQKDIPQSLKCDGNITESFPMQIIFTSKDFIESVSHDQIKIIKGSISKLTENGIVINGNEIEADVIVFATGFKKQYFGFGEDQLWLYRNMIKPGIKNLAFLGMVVSLYFPTTVNVQAVWLTEVLRGIVCLPEFKQMESEIQVRKQGYAKTFPREAARAHSWMPNIAILEPLLDDMGLSKTRKDYLWKEWLKLPSAVDLKTVVTHRKQLS